MKYPSILKKIIITAGLYFVAQYSLWGSTFGIEGLIGNIYFNGIFLAFASLFGMMSIPIWLKYMKRKTALYITFFIMIFSSLGFIIIPVPD